MQKINTFDYKSQHSLIQLALMYLMQKLRLKIKTGRFGGYFLKYFSQSFLNIGRVKVESQKASDGTMALSHGLETLIALR